MQHVAADRRSQSDHVVALSLDKPHPQDSQSFDYRILDFGDYTNVVGSAELSLLGMTGRTLPDGTLNLYFVNAAPSFDLNTQLPTDQTVTGINSTIEAFSMSPGSSTLEHLHTFYNPTNITTPNNVAVRPDGSIIVSNDHGPHGSGLQHTLSPMLGTGSIAHCIPPATSGSISPCTLITSERHAFPNGLHISPKDSLLYVPSSVTGKISVYRSTRYNTSPSSLSKLPPIEDASHLDSLNHSPADLELLTKIHLKMPLDNISEDADGNLIVAAFPKISEVEEMLKDSTPIDGRGIATTILKVSRSGEEGEYVVSKLLEDPKGEILPGATTAVRDAKTGRVFVVGVLSPWIAVCEPR